MWNTLEFMDDDSFRKLILSLSGPSRDRARLSKLLGITESTAYGWIRLSEQNQLGVNTSVRGDQNRLAKAVLVEAAEELERGQLQMGDVELFLRGRLPTPEPVDGGAPINPATDVEQQRADDLRKAALKRGLQYVMGRFDSATTADELIAAIETVVAMNKEKL